MLQATGTNVVETWSVRVSLSLPARLWNITGVFLCKISGEYRATTLAKTAVRDCALECGCGDYPAIRLHIREISGIYQLSNIFV